MARDYGRISTKFWISEDVRGISDRGRLLAAYLLTSPHSNLLGAYLLPDAYVADDLKWPCEAVAKAFTELFGKGFATRFKDGRHVCIKLFLEYNPIENPNAAKAALKLLEQMPDDPAVAFIVKGLEPYRHHFGNRWQEVEKRLANPSEGVPKPVPTQEQEQEQDQKQEQESLPGTPGDARYPAEFEEFWLAFKNPPNSKKPEALKAWTQTEGLRPPLKDLLAAVAGYNAWLDQENRKRRPNDQHPKQHASTWLRGEVWNGFAPKADATPADDDRIRAAWGGRAAPLVEEIGAAQFIAWFGGSSFKLGPPCAIRVPKPFSANWINQHFSRALERHFGPDCRAEVAAPPPDAKAARAAEKWLQTNGVNP